MVRHRHNPLIKICFALAALGLLSAFSYPLMQEGYQMVGVSVYRKAQMQLIEQLMREYVALAGTPDWKSSTTTRDILTDMSTGVQISGGTKTFLPPSETVENLSNNYRIVYKGPNSFKIIPR